MSQDQVWLLARGHSSESAFSGVAGIDCADDAPLSHRLVRNSPGPRYMAVRSAHRTYRPPSEQRRDDLGRSPRRRSAVLASTSSDVRAFGRTQGPGGRRTGLLMPGSGPLTTVEGSPWHPQRSARYAPRLTCDASGWTAITTMSFPCSRLIPSSPATFPWTSRIVWAVCSSFSEPSHFRLELVHLRADGIALGGLADRVLLGVRP